MALDARSQIATAKQMAERAHAGQNYGSRPYLWHVEQVVLGVMKITKDADAVVVAWLHDVVEDSSLFTIEELAGEFSPKIAKAVDAITKRTRESYPIYLARVRQNPIATTVKGCDVQVNLAASRRLVKKYERAQRLLQEEAEHK